MKNIDVKKIKDFLKAIVTDIRTGGTEEPEEVASRVHQLLEKLSEQINENCKMTMEKKSRAEKANMANNINKSNLRIISRNANSIRAHCHQLKLFIDNASIKPQIICIQETWLKKTIKLHNTRL